MRARLQRIRAVQEEMWISVCYRDHPVVKAIVRLVTLRIRELAR